MGSTKPPVKDQCSHIRRAGKRCKRWAKPGHDVCIAHTPEGIAKTESLVFEYEAKMLAAGKEDVAKLLDDINYYRKQSWNERQKFYDLQIKVDQVRSEIFEMEHILSKKEDLKRLLQCFETAKDAGDAKSMIEAQKTLYYARKRIGPSADQYVSSSVGTGV